MLSAALHLGILLLISLAAGGRRPPALPAVPLYLDLAGPAGVAPSTPRAVPCASPRPRAAAVAAPARQPAAGEAEAPEPAAGPQAVPAGGEAQGLEISRAFAGAARMQAKARNTRDYLDTTAKAVQKLLEGRLASGGLGTFEGEHAAVEVSYAAGALPEVSVAAENRGLGGALQGGVAWSKVPAPEKYYLGFHKVTFLVSLEQGRVKVGVSPQ